MNTGRDLQQRRIKLGFGQEDIAKKMGVSNSLISFIENNRNRYWNYLRRYDEILSTYEKQRLEELISSYPAKTMEIVARNYLRATYTPSADGEAA